MATTAAGRSYTPHVWSNSADDLSIWAVADDLVSTTYPKPALLICHGAGGTYDQFTTQPYTQRLRDAVIDSGWVYIESDGGGPSHWGREFAMESYYAAVTEAAEMHPLGTMAVMGRSMGGTVASSLALNAEWGLKQHITGLVLQAGVQSLEYWHVTMGKQLGGRYPEGRAESGGDYEAFMAASEPFDPLRFPVEWYSDMAVQFISGTHDASVPAEGNAIPQYERVKGTALYADLYLRGLGTHSSTEFGDPMIFKTQWDFIRRAQGLYPDAVTLSAGSSVLDAGATYYTPGWRQAVPLT